MILKVEFLSIQLQLFPKFQTSRINSSNHYVVIINQDIWSFWFQLSSRPPVHLLSAASFVNLTALVSKVYTSKINSSKHCCCLKSRLFLIFLILNFNLTTFSTFFNSTALVTKIQRAKINSSKHCCRLKLRLLILLILNFHLDSVKLWTEVNWKLTALTGDYLLFDTAKLRWK